MLARRAGRCGTSITLDPARWCGAARSRPNTAPQASGRPGRGPRAILGHGRGNADPPGARPDQPDRGRRRGQRAPAAERIERARDAGAQLVVLPELCLSGYPPEDLLLRRDFLDAVRRGARALAADVTGIVALVGFPERVERPEPRRPTRSSTRSRPPAHNSLAVLADGEVAAVYRKVHLPNYGVFDERRYFEPGDRARPDRGRRRPGRPHGLRGHLGPRRPPRARRRPPARG